MFRIKTTTRLLCAHPPPVSDEWAAYTAYMAELLGGDLVYDDAHEENWWQKMPASAGDLIIHYQPPLRWQERVWRGSTAQRLLARAPLSAIVVSRYYLPLRHILLLLRLDDGDEAALAWTTRLARASDATVTVLPLLPPIPVLYSHEICSRAGMERFLESNTPAAARVSAVLQHCDNDRLDFALVLRPGEPLCQVKEEMATTAYDLVVIGGGNTGSRGDAAFIAGLLRRMACPLLIARGQAGRGDAH